MEKTIKLPNIKILIFIFTAIFGSAFAQRPIFHEDDPNHTNAASRPGKPAGLQIGGGVLVNTRPYKGIDSRVIGIPFVMYEGKDWSFKGTRFDYKLTEEGPYSIKALLRLRTEGYDADDSSTLKGMDDRKVTLDAGFCFAYKHRLATFRFDALTDTLGINKGQELAVSISKAIHAPFGLKKAFITPFAGAEWRTTSLNDYYYGVRPNEAAPNRSPYKSASDTNIFLGISCNYRLNKDTSIFTMIKNNFLGDEIQDSPIVNKDYAISIVTGLVYNF